MSAIPYASVKQLAHKIKRFGNSHPRFAFLLGAGASRQSGIITAGEMVRFFKESIIAEHASEQLNTDEEREIWLSAQEWYSPDANQYSQLFEQFEPKEIGRQRYIESIIEDQQASFGYVVLANLIASNYINTIITTNFDDLVYGACTSYTGIRPIVYAYGVLASEMRITAQRPKILKLHGDYLYSTIKNTGSETAMQDPNMARQVVQVLSEYGMVVLGYSGEDKSVMEILRGISAKNDLYWCVMRGTEPNQAVKDLLLQKSGFLVEIAGFDEMMNEIRQIVGFDVRKMLGSIQERQEFMIENLKYFGRHSTAAMGSSDQRQKVGASGIGGILSEIVEALQSKTTEEQQQIKKIQALDFFTKALEAQEVGDSTTAEKLYQEALELDPNDANAYNNLGTVLTRPAEAEAAFRRTIELDPTYATAYYNLAVLLEKDETRAAEAEQAYRQSIELDPADVAAYSNLGGLISKDESRLAEAEGAFRQAIALAPGDAGGYYNLGVVLAKDATRSAEAEAAYRKSIELDPAYASAYYNFAVLIDKDETRQAEAEAAYRQAIELDPKDAAAYYNLAVLLEKDEARVTEAEELYRKSIELEPSDSAAYLNLAVLISKDETRATEAEAAFRKATELAPNDSTGYYNLGVVIAKDATRSAEAEAAFRESIKVAPDDGTGYYNLGVLIAKDPKRSAEAEAAFRKSIELSPGDADSYLSLGNLLRSLGRHAEALALTESLLQLDAQNINALLTLASINKKIGNEADAAKYLDQAREVIKPDDWYNLACLESIQANADAAIANLRKAAETDSASLEWATDDPDLEWIRNDPRFAEIVAVKPGK